MDAEDAERGLLERDGDSVERAHMRGVRRLGYSCACGHLARLTIVSHATRWRRVDRAEHLLCAALDLRMLSSIESL